MTANNCEKKHVDKSAIPVSVIDELIAELKAEKNDTNRIITHSITALELLKARWKRLQKEGVEN